MFFTPPIYSVFCYLFKRISGPMRLHTSFCISFRYKEYDWQTEQKFDKVRLLNLENGIPLFCCGGAINFSPKSIYKRCLYQILDLRQKHIRVFDLPHFIDHNRTIFILHNYKTQFFCCKTLDWNFSKEKTYIRISWFQIINFVRQQLNLNQKFHLETRKVLNHLNYVLGIGIK